MYAIVSPTAEKDIAAYARMQDALDADYFGKWVVFHDGELIGVFDEFDHAAAEEIRRFGPGSCLIRLVGAVRYPSSLRYVTATNESNSAKRDRAKIAMEIAAYERMQDVLETDCFGKWVVIHGGELAGAFDTDSDAASEAFRRFGRGPYLIRQVGASPYAISAPSFTALSGRRDADR